MARLTCSALAVLTIYFTVAGAKPTMQYDTIVVGLGSAGVTAATTLARAGSRVLGLEAQGRIGGRVYTVPFGDGVVELGAEWIHGSRGSRVYEAAVRNSITILSQNATADVYRSDGSKADDTLVNELIEYSVDAIKSPGNEKGPVGEYLRIKIKDYLKQRRPEVLEDADFLKSFFDLMDLLVDNDEGSDSWDDVSLYSDYEELEGDKQLSWNRYGYKTFFELMLNTYKESPGLPNLDIKLNSEVTKITWPREPSEAVEVTCANGQTYKAYSVIITVSVGVLKERYHTLFNRPLPEYKVRAIESITMGVLDKIIFSFEEPWWPKWRSCFGFLWREEDKRKVAEEDYWTTKIFGATTTMGSSNTLTLWTSGDTGKFVETLPLDEVKNKSVELLQMFLGVNLTVPEPTGMLRTAWFLNPYTRGSFTFDSMASMKSPNSRADLGEPLYDRSGAPRVLFAGEASSIRHFSNVHGASETGYREAIRLLPSSEI